MTGGLHLLNRKLRFKLEKVPGSGTSTPLDITAQAASSSQHIDPEDNNKVSDKSGLINYSGRTFKMEPLATVNDLEKYLLKMVLLLSSSHPAK